MAVHGDLFPENLIVTEAGESALIDWDEALADLAVFDLAAVAGDALTGAERQARTAWEIARSWQVEPTYAQRLLAENVRV